MFIDLTPEQHALRLKVRDYFNALMTPELRLELRAAPGAVVTITSPAGVLTLHGLAAGLSVHAATTDRRAEA